MRSIISCNGVESGKRDFKYLTSYKFYFYQLCLNFSHGLKTIPIRYHAKFTLVGNLLNTHCSHRGRRKTGDRSKEHVAEW
ncbi:hypothetical protein ERO13_A04G049200v2 [Gossypium hirsutum]|uniref:Uncharacterized protein n=2 Tax=Gossypium TaxID=3633 RepID=A0A5J5W475_GOSBA|nr:hypothetical protein ES319_A04G060500v1 [Gossypium barbadense]KAG4204520.1 hypothetical protein ERO13_A04G049200v2 [Gossypium hirsutum]TYJ39406.1 hypothetical protein E1A91_A04G068200v1 [Gossypium mustelinum]